jgi:hypothetical protein
MHRVRILAVAAGGVVLLGLGLPWKYYRYPGDGGRVQLIDFWGATTLEAMFYALLVIPIPILAAPGNRAEPPSRKVSLSLLILAGLATAFGLLLLGLFLADAKWDAGLGVFVQVLGSALGVAAGVMGLRSRAAGS